MNSPNAIPRSPKLAYESLVGAGSQILPGAVCLVTPSKSRTKMMSKVEIIPRIDAKDSRESGKNAEGISLNRGVVSEGITSEDSSVHEKSNNFVGISRISRQDRMQRICV